MGFATMKTATTVVQMLIRTTWLIALVLGVVLWTGRPALMIVHEGWGIAFVLALWALVYLGVRSGTGRETNSPGVTLPLALWSLVVLFVGVTQKSILSGASHWVARVLHLLVGIVAMGLAEALGARIRRRLVSRPT
jgi:hypothetical protein